MLDRPHHGGMLAIGNSKLFGGLFYDLCERSIVGVAHERTKMMDDVMVETADEPAYQRVTRRVIGCCRENVIYAVVKLAAVRRKVCAVKTVRGLEHK